MARIRIAGFYEGRKRKLLRKKITRGVPRKNRAEAKKAVARAMEREARARAFKAIGVRSKKTKAKLTRKLFEAKVKALKEFDPELEDEDARALAERTNLSRVQRRVFYKERAGWMEEPLGSGMFRKMEIYKVGRRKKMRPVINPKTGKPFKRVTRGKVASALGSRAYVARVKALQKAWGVSFREAQAADAAMFDLPEGVRRRIYEQIVTRFR